MNYPMKVTTERALTRLFGDIDVPFGLLAQGVPLSQRDVQCTPETSVAERMRQLCDRLESFIVQMAQELDELGDDELPRLRSEAAALLLALREIQTHFPDMISGPGK